MAAVTALQLVNRVRRRLRVETVGNVSDRHSQAILDLLNGSIADVLASKDWKFDRRHDGVLEVIAPQTTDIWTTNVGFFNVSSTDPVMLFTQALWRRGDLISRLKLTEDPTFGDVSFRVDSCNSTGSVFTAFLEIGWPGAAAVASYTGTMFVSEYLLPDTVREVISIKNEDTPLVLRQIDAGARFEELVPRQTDMFSDPEWVGVGGYDLATYETGQSSGTPLQRLVLWPVPDKSLVLHYSYYYNHPRLVDSDDTLDGVPEHIVEDIVRLTHGDALTTLDKDVKEGLATSRDARRRNDDKYASHDPQPARRNSMSSWNGTRTITSRNVKNGFPGVTILE